MPRFGRVITIDYGLAIPDHRLSWKKEPFDPGRQGRGWVPEDLLQFCRRRKIPTRKPFESLTPLTDLGDQGDPDYGTMPIISGPRLGMGSRVTSIGWNPNPIRCVRVLLSRYRSYQLCPECQGARLQPESLNTACLCREKHPLG